MPMQIVIAGFDSAAVSSLCDMLQASCVRLRAAMREGPAMQFAHDMSDMIVTARPDDLFEIDKIAKALAGQKAAKFVVLVRDPRTLVSARDRRGEYLFGFEHGLRELEDGLMTYSGPGIAAADRAMQTVREQGAEIHLVQQEQFLSEKDRVIAGILRFTGLAADSGDEPDDPPPNRDWFPAAPEDAARIARQFRLAPGLFDVLARWGYGTGRSWFTELAEAVPQAADDTPGLIVGFYTAGTRYEEEARRMEASIRRFNIPLELTAMEPIEGGWFANVRRKPGFLLEKRRQYRGQILYIDVDGVTHRDPWPYLRDYAGDIAVSTHTNGNIISATLLLNDTPGTIRLIEAWIDELPRQIGTGDQWSLQQVVQANRAGAFAPPFHVQYLPPSLCCVFDRTRRAVPSVDPIIEHLQASREFRAASGKQNDRANLERRQRRIAEINESLGIPVPKKQAAALFKRANAHVKAGEFAQAARCLEKLLETFDHVIEDTRAQVHRRYGACLIQTGDREGALSQTRLAVEAAGDDIEVLCQCVDNFLRAKDSGEGWKTLNRLEEISANSPEVRLRRARLLSAEGKAADAVAILDELATLEDLDSPVLAATQKLRERLR